jgi:hypothetical protein
MAVTAKKLGQSALTTDPTPTTIVTGVSSGHTEISSLWISNTNASTVRYVTIFAHGSGVSTDNILIPYLELPANGVQLVQLNNSPIILDDSETLRAYQDTGTDVIVTAYGIEEV